MPDEIPKIELFVSDVSQEFPPAERMREAFSVEDNEWEAWENDWGYDWDDTWSGPGADELGRPVIPDLINIRDIKLREENFGGLVYIPSTRRVLKANSAGMEIIKALQDGSLADSSISPEHAEIVKNMLTNEKVKV